MAILVIPPCDNHNGTYPTVVGHPRSMRIPGDAEVNLPADYDGWLQYTAYHDTEGFDSFIGKFTVPDNPKRHPHILYLFTGLQNIDWIPKVDAEPSEAFDIIQPVIQYPADWGEDHWSVKSWYVTLKAGALHSREVPCKTGDVVLGVMNRTGAESWVISSTVQSSGKTTSQTVSNKRLVSQPWAYTTLECYGCRDCSTYPKAPVNFTDMTLTTGNGPVRSFAWEKNPKPQPDQKCNENVHIQDQTSVLYTFQ